ncbi:MAG: hypothetical protein B7C24_09650 [Bacteroidetes bacterium 4572_77]|nr:MAG: hypothetical protein B7C24_09650 [Bacteroidetes bacterium 4572_77]
MNKMTGILLIIIGIIVFVIGILIYNSSTKPKNGKDKDLGTTEVKHTLSKTNSQKENSHGFNEKTSKSNELNKIVEMALADGILTENERKLIKKIALEQKLDYKDIIKNAEKKLRESKLEPETELINHKKKKGDDFEKYIVQKFNLEYFRIKEWAGDKYIKGIYAETTPQPDLLLEFSLNNKIYPFAVECKWRQHISPGGIEFAKNDQFNRYKEYENSKNIPVFIAIGIGGKANSPESIYIVPLRFIETNFISIKNLNKYKKDVNKNFYYDIKTKILKQKKY